MAAYCLFDVLEITDPAGMERYRQQVGPVVEQFGGRYVVIGGECHVAEGAWTPTFPVLIRFLDMASARAWHESREYRALLEMRTASARTNAVFLQSWPGLDP